jgi:hypothetical protein
MSGTSRTANIIKNQVRLHTGTRFHQYNEIRRASEQTSPQMARAAGHTPKIGGPETGLERRIEQWQQLGSPFSVKRLVFEVR